MYVGLMTFAFCTHVAILTTPGFYSHDEWQVHDAIKTIGFWEFAQSYGAFRVGPHFGAPTRPIGFLHLGIASLWMQSSPLISHLFGVANHAIAAVVFAWVIIRAGLSTFVAGLAAALFIVSPLSTLATGWVGASFDQLYVIFVLLVTAVLVTLPERAFGIRAAACVALGSTAALLSKETAVAIIGIPVILGYVAWARAPHSFRIRPYALALLTVAVPVAVYLLYRSSAIAHSISASDVGVYAPNIRNIPTNAIYYFAYPFALRLDDMTGSVATWQVVAATLIHASLIALLFRFFGLWSSAAYLGSYFLFLIPVLVLPGRGAHYLYASGLPMALAMAALYARARLDRVRWLQAVLVICGVVLVAHTVKAQAFIYKTGQCQNQLLTSLEMLWGAVPGSAMHGIRIIPEPGAPLHVAIRALFQRVPYQKNDRSLIEFDEAVAGNERVSASPQSVLLVRMSRSCALSLINP